MRLSVHLPLLLCLGALACSDEKREPPAPSDAGRAADADESDLGAAPDAESEDAGAVEDATAADADLEDASTGPTIIRFVSSRSQVTSGETVELQWEVSGATSISVTAVPGGALVDSSTIAIGSVTSAPINFTTTFRLDARDEQSRTAMRQVTVTFDPGQPMILSFTANPETVAAESTTTLSWTTSNALRVRILQGASELFVSTTMVDAGEFVTAPLPLGQHPFTLEASNFANQTTQLVVVGAN
jgi:hypothetical protein